MKYLIIAALSLSTVLAIPSHYPYPIHPGVGAIYKGAREETIIEGPDGSVITAESDSAGSIKLDSPPRVIDPAPAINLENTGPNLFNSGNEQLRARAGLAANAGAAYLEGGGGGLVNAGDGLVHSGPSFVNTGDGLGNSGRAFVGAGDAVAHSGQGFVNAGDGLAHSGQGFVNAGNAAFLNAENALAHSAQAFANTVDDFAHSGPAFVSAGDGLAHSGQAFVNTGDGLAHSGQAFVNARDGLAHSGQAFVNAGDGLAHSGQAFVNTGDGLAHSGPAFVNTGDGLTHSGQAFVNAANAFAHSGQAFVNTRSGNSDGSFVHSGGGFVQSGDGGNIRGGLVHTDPELVPLVHQPPVLVNQAPAVVSVDRVAPAVINTAAPVILNENPIVVPDEPKIVEEHVIVGNKVISVPKLVEGNTDLVGPSGTISTRGGDTVISGPASITVKGDGVITEIDKQPDVLIKTVEVKPVVAPVVIKPVAPIATIEHTVVSNPIITEARPLLAPKRTVYAGTAPLLGINPIVTTKVIDGLNPILSHTPAIIKSGPILATSFAEHNAVFGKPHYAPEFLPLEPFSFKPIYGPLH